MAAPGDSMVERVARSMFSTDWPHDNWDRFGSKDTAVERYRAMARAAIEAMREPTERMKQEYAHPVFGDTLWRDMIEAALKEEPR